MDDGPHDTTALSPDDAFAVLGNETRFGILRALGEVDGPCSFSHLRDRVGVADSGQFNYHLDRLVGHFVEHTDEGYGLRRAGERVVEAVLSGAVTEAPVVAPTTVDRPCQYCGAPVGITYDEERVRVYCTECEGIYGERSEVDGAGHLGTLFVPPAGLHDRSASELLQAAYVWGELSVMAATNGVCPRCAATVEESVHVCERHDGGDGPCPRCDERFAVGVHLECTNCLYDRGGAFGVRLLSNTDLLAFLTDRGVNPVAPRRTRPSARWSTTRRNWSRRTRSRPASRSRRRATR
ncbi:ArsR/SmtB family transcription factor [Halomarina litorea]|uniref:ArsR/SmtB family transcription factor n=1 Tax=Halomarina litorea TaxID=2961595 RepID=UPI0020C33741|nr:helix-turn-helix domain-containing protein [Halomarina sp. BCD28]